MNPVIEDIIDVLKAQRDFNSNQSEFNVHVLQKLTDIQKIFDELISKISQLEKK